MPRCLMAKHGVSIRSDGGTAPCCAWRNVNQSDRMIFDDTGSWKKFNDNIYKELETQWLPGCEECRIGEETNGKSLRTYANSMFTAESSGIEYWDFKLNTTCNLTCKMCASHSSSAWARDVRAHSSLLKDTVYAEGLNKPRLWKQEDGLNIEEFYPALLDAKFVKFTGGEPFLIPEVKKCIEFLVESEASHNVHLQLITNGTQRLESWNHLFEKFKHVVISISIEAIGELYEYIRQGASWDKVSKNIVHFQNVKPSNTTVSINYLPMALNISADVELKAWCDNHGLHFSRSTEVINPAFMRPSAITDASLRKELIYHLQILDKIYNTDYKTAVHYLNEDTVND